MSQCLHNSWLSSDSRCSDSWSHVGTLLAPFFFPANPFISTECCVHHSTLATSFFWKRAQSCSVMRILPSNLKPLQNSIWSKLFRFSLNGKAFCPVYSKMRCKENKKQKPSNKTEKNKSDHWDVILHKKTINVDYFSERSLILNQELFLNT